LYDIKNISLSDQNETTMKNQSLTIGQEVVRSKGDYVVGRIGIIIAIDTEKNRAQVSWNGETTTWVSFNALELTSIPYEIVSYKYRRLA